MEDTQHQYFASTFVHTQFYLYLPAPTCPPIYLWTCLYLCIHMSHTHEVVRWSQGLAELVMGKTIKLRWHLTFTSPFIVTARLHIEKSPLGKITCIVLLPQWPSICHQTLRWEEDVRCVNITSRKALSNCNSVWMSCLSISPGLWWATGMTLRILQLCLLPPEIIIGLWIFITGESSCCRQRVTETLVSSRRSPNRLCRQRRYHLNRQCLFFPLFILFFSLF